MDLSRGDTQGFYSLVVGMSDKRAVEFVNENTGMEFAIRFVAGFARVVPTMSCL